MCIAVLTGVYRHPSRGRRERFSLRTDTVSSRWQFLPAFPRKKVEPDSALATGPLALGDNERNDTVGRLLAKEEPVRVHEDDCLHQHVHGISAAVLQGLMHAGQILLQVTVSLALPAGTATRAACSTGARARQRRGRLPRSRIACTPNRAGGTPCPRACSKHRKVACLCTRHR